jgi:hypothetical protein
VRHIVRFASQVVTKVVDRIWSVGCRGCGGGVDCCKKHW